jgi:hypothetical protein
MLRKSVVPYVLTQSAMKTGYMPPEGESALPPSLEWDVPPELRYWKAACGQDPREIRDQLVQAQLFTEDSVRIVDDVPRRTFTKLFIAEPFPAAPDVFAELLAEARPEAALFKAYVGTPDAFVAAVTLAKDGLPSEAADNMPAALFLFYADEPPPLVEDVDQCTDKFLVGARDTQETRERFEKVGRPFHLAGVDSHIFVASHPVPGEVTYLETVLPVANESAEAAIGKCEVHVLKATADEDEHYVLGIVLEPETVDSQQDVYSVAEVRKSAYRFMAFHQNVGLMHKSIVNDQVRIVESYVAPVDCEIGGQTVKQGTWLMGVIVEDDALWGEVKSGAFTGFSIGGSAVRTAEDTAA